MPKTLTTEMTDEGLKKISELITKEKRNLIPHPQHPEQDMVRTDGLWREYSRKGVFLSNGGVERSFFTEDQMAEILKSPNLQSFNLYRTDRPQSVIIASEEIGAFLHEEGLAPEDQSNLFFKFCLGSHEGFTRLVDCIKNSKNTGMLYPQGGYGLLVRAVSTRREGQFDTHVVETEPSNGEKISVAALQKEMAKHPNAKTVYVESKTICGAVYNDDEMEKIIKFCEKNKLFLIVDTAHANMELYPDAKVTNAAALCKKNNYKDFAVIFTGSKTYGLERARVGFVIFGDEDLAKVFDKELSKRLGSMSDLSFEIAKSLISSDVSQRKEFLRENSERHRHNMNLMIAYIEGLNSPNIDKDMRELITKEILPEYQNGIEGLKIVFKPESGIQLKIDTSGLKDKFFGNIKMFNSEIFSYALHATTDVVTLHSYQLMNPDGNKMRLSFSVERDIHEGMKRMHDFVKYGLSNTVAPNPYMPDTTLAEEFIFPTQEEMDAVVKASREQELEEDRLMSQYRDNLNKTLPKFTKPNSDFLDSSINEAASTIQRSWRKFSPKSASKLIQEISKSNSRS